MKLLPCPFCGGPADPSPSTYLIRCSNVNCRAHVKVFADSPAEVVETWNTRAPAPPVSGDLREAIARLSSNHFAGMDTLRSFALDIVKAQAETEARLWAKLAYLVDESTYEDSYGVQGSDFLCCRFCEAGGVPNVSFVHNEKCPVLRCEDVATEWWNDLKADREIIKAQAEALDVAVLALEEARVEMEFLARYARKETDGPAEIDTALAKIKELRG